MKIDFTTALFNIESLQKDGAVAMAKALGLKFDQARAATPELKFILSYCAHQKLWELAAAAGAGPEDLAECLLDDADEQFNQEDALVKLYDLRQLRASKGKPASPLDHIVDELAAGKGFDGVCDAGGKRSRAKAKAAETEAATEQDDAAKAADFAAAVGKATGEAIQNATNAVAAAETKPATKPEGKKMDSAKPVVAGADLGATLAAAINAAMGASLGITPEKVQAMVVEEVGNRVATVTVAMNDATTKVDAAMTEFESLKTAIATSAAKVIKERIDELEKTAVRKIVVNDAKTGETRDLGVQHFRFPMLLKAAEARTQDGHRLNIWLTGPAGTGKTTAARKLSEALGLAHAFNGAIDTEYKLLGFTDAMGKIVSRPFRDIWEKGGVYLFDEIDGSYPNAVLALNAALANGWCDFPDGAVQRHPDCIIIAGANTNGLGATAAMISRIKQDAAFLDRFVEMLWPIDENLERKLCPDTDWCDFVQLARKKALERGVAVVISPRASFNGAALLATGLDVDQVKLMTVFKGMTKEQIAELQKVL